MCRLQQRVALVGRVAGAVLRQRRRHAAFVPANRVGGERRLGDVVAEKEDDVGVLGDDVAPGRIVADLVALAAGDDKAQACRRIRRWRGTRAANRALLAEGAEAIPILACRREPGGLGMDAVRPIGLGDFFAAGDDMAETFVVGHFPAHAGVLRQVGSGEPRPEDHAGLVRLAGSDAEGKARQISGARAAGKVRHRGDRRRALQKAATRQRQGHTPTSSISR